MKIPHNAKVYVAGHTGLVGSALLRKYKGAGYTNLITATHQELDLTDASATKAFFEKEKPEYVIIAAARVGGIRANMTYPADFMYENLMIQNNLMWNAHTYDVKKLLFLSCGCAYPTSAPQPLQTEHILTGIPEPTNEGFALAKIVGMKLCEKITKQYGKTFISCIPANTYGLNDHFEEEKSHVIPALIKKFHEAKISNAPSVTMWGKGLAVREFIYVDDLANALYMLMEEYEKPETINIGSHEEVSMKHLAELIQKVVGYNGLIEYDTSKPDGMLKRTLDSTVIKKMGFQPTTSLENGLKKTYEYFLSKA